MVYTLQKGVPMPLIKTLFGGHKNTLLCGKEKGITSEYASSNIGVSQWIHISAQRFNIYTDNITNE